MIRDADPNRKPKRRANDFRQTLSQSQLAAIGSVALAWNDLQYLLILTFNTCLGYHARTNTEIASRINGFEGIIALIRYFVIKEFSFDQDYIKEFQKAFGNIISLVGECKAFRDALVHARVFDDSLNIGEKVEVRGEKRHVLISEEAANCVLERTLHARNELEIALKYLSILRFFPRVSKGSWDAEIREKQSLDLELHTYMSQLGQLQKRCKSLARPPKFPKEFLTPSR